MHRACLLGEHKLLKQLLKHFDEQQPSQLSQVLHATTFKRKSTALHFAAIAGSHKCCEELIMQGADKQAVDVRGRDALVWALQSHDLDTMFVMLQAGLGLDSLDSKGQNLQHAVCRGCIEQGQQIHENCNRPRARNVRAHFVCALLVTCGVTG